MKYFINHLLLILLLTDAYNKLIVITSMCAIKIQQDCAGHGFATITRCAGTKRNGCL